MAEFQAFEQGMQVNGTTIMAVVDGMGAFQAVAVRILADAGLSHVEPSPTVWYSQQAWLNAFKTIAVEIGDSTIFLIGQKIPENAVFPPEIDSTEKALAAIDVAYHMNHRNARGQVLFDPAHPGEMLEGIGHYRFEPVGKNETRMVCENPYPCHFDRGIIVAMASRFCRHAQVDHADEEPCRRRGAESCTYQVTWR